MADKPIKPANSRSSSKEITAFLTKVADASTVVTATVGRLLFVMDATASRQSHWETACRLQGKMFEATAQQGGLAVQLCYYRGFDEFVATPWYVDTNKLLGRMRSVNCIGGYTQIGRALGHAIQETRSQKVNAVIIVSDAMEEKVDDLCRLSGQLGLLNTPIFAFQEGYDPIVSHAFTQMAHLSRGAYCAFNENSANELADLLSAVAVYASGGYKALENFSKNATASVKLLTQQIDR